MNVEEDRFKELEQSYRVAHLKAMGSSPIDMIQVDAKACMLCAKQYIDELELMLQEMHIILIQIGESVEKGDLKLKDVYLIDALKDITQSYESEGEEGQK